MTEMSADEAAVVARFEAGEPAPESYRPSEDDGLRTAIRLALAQWSVVPLTHLGYIADAVLALPEVAALRAKADAADRVRVLLNGAVMVPQAEIRRALNGSDREDRGRC